MSALFESTQLKVSLFSKRRAGRGTELASGEVHYILLDICVENFSECGAAAGTVCEGYLAEPIQKMCAERV